MEATREEIQEWIDRTYGAGPGDRFSRWNMEAAFRAGHAAADRARARDGLARAMQREANAVLWATAAGVVMAAAVFGYLIWFR